MSEARTRVRKALTGAKALELVPNTGPNDSVHGLPPGCPVVPLGLAGDVRYYLDADQQMIALPAGDHSRLKLLGLFGQFSEFIYTHDRWTRKNEHGSVTGWRPELVAEDLMIACSRAGVWDPSNRERGRGAWCGEDGELIMHLGDQIMIFPCLPEPWRGRMVLRPGMIGRHVYPRAERVGVPSDVDHTADEPAQELLNLLETWQWRREELDAVLMLGWIGAAMIGGALKWRPSAWLTGGKGTGKSSLQNALREILGGALIDIADTSPAFIWQTLRNQTLPVDVDELEAEEDNRKSLAVVKLARISASGGKLGRGGDKHVPLDFTLRSAFLFSSVLIPPLSGPDRSRLAILDLHELPHGAAMPDLTPARLRALGSALRRRLIDGWPRFEATLEAYRRALFGAGHDARGADQFGTLLACADVLMFVDTPHASHAGEWVAKLGTADLSESVDSQRDEDQCLQHLLAVPIDPYRKGDRVNLGEWINRAAGRSPGFDDAREAMRILGGYGVRIEREGRTNYVAIANNHSGLCGLYDDTRWKTPRGLTGVWVQSLRRLPGAIRGTRSMYFGGPSSKATLLPLDLIPAPDGNTQQSFDSV